MSDLTDGYEYFRSAIKGTFLHFADIDVDDINDYSYEDCVHRLVDHKQSVRVELPRGCSAAFILGADQAKDTLLKMIEEYRRSKEARTYNIQF